MAGEWNQDLVGGHQAQAGEGIIDEPAAEQHNHRIAEAGNFQQAQEALRWDVVVFVKIGTEDQQINLVGQGWPDQIFQTAAGQRATFNFRHRQVEVVDTGDRQQLAFPGAFAQQQVCLGTDQITVDNQYASIIFAQLDSQFTTELRAVPDA